MEMLGVNNPAMMKWKKQKRNDVLKKKEKEKNIKVTYISSPMKVKTSASNFRALVQELTGQDSNVAEAFGEADHENDENAPKGTTSIDEQQWRVGVHDDEGYMPHQEGSWLDLPADYSAFQYSRSLLEPFNQHHLQFDMVQI